MVLRLRYKPKIEAHKRSLKRKGRPSLAHWSNSVCRVVSEQGNLSFNLPDEYIQARDRLVCNKPQQEAGDLCLANVRPGGLGRGRNVHKLVQPPVLCLSPNNNVVGSANQNKENKELPCPAGSPSVGKSNVPPTINATKHRLPDKVEVPVAPKPVIPTGKKTHQRTYTEASRLEFVRRQIKTRGFSKRASQSITAAVRPTTSGVYDQKWLVFCRWCRGRKIPPTKAYVSDIADFLVSLQDRGRAPVTVEGYRTAISETFKFSD